MWQGLVMMKRRLRPDGFRPGVYLLGVEVQPHLAGGEAVDVDPGLLHVQQLL